MMVIDTHSHVSPYWYEPVESLLFQMDRYGVAQALLVQYMGQFDNEYQFECERRYPGRFGSIVLVDTLDPKATQALERLAGQGARGVRLRPDTRSPGSDPLAIWRKAEELDLPVTCGSTSAGFASPTFAELVQEVPRLTIIIEHLGSINSPDGEPSPYQMRRKALSLSEFPNVYIKVHGLGEFCQRTNPIQQPFPFETPIPPFLEMAYEAFGPERMMWGSDFPPVCSREGYGNSLRLTMERFESKSERDRELIFGAVAKKVYRL